VTTQTLSIVVPLYNEEDVFAELCRRLSSTAVSLVDYDVEILFVSDGSSDSTNQLIESQVNSDPRFKGILLARNFGHQAAVSTGIEYASGELVAVIDGDLQDPPEVIASLIKAINDGADVAYAVRRKRKENVLKRTAYSLFYRTLRTVSEIDIPLDTGDFCCMKRNVIDAMLKLPERTRFIRGLRAWVGFRQVGVEYEREARFAGRPQYTFRKLLGLAIDGLFSFSGLPVKVMQILGFAISMLALATATTYFVWYFIDRGAFPTGFATLAISIWFLAGIQLLFLGIVGEYVVRTFDESRRRPTAIVAEFIARN
jgi:glycosyltransferase involved in cell wall biosynthesis